MAGMTHGMDSESLPAFRVIARLDIKGPDLIKGISFEGVRKLGDPGKFSIQYYENQADELLYMDAVASLYDRNYLKELVRTAAKKCFMPITVGGGIRKLEDVEQLLQSGADKVAINTGVVRNPKLIAEVANRFGSQCMVLSIEAKKKTEKSWEVYTESGREHTGMDVIDWLKKTIDLGVGEVLITSVDQDGTGKGFDIELIRQVAEISPVPVIASGGFGKLAHIDQLLQSTNVQGIAVGWALHLGKITISEIKDHLHQQHHQHVRLTQ